MDNQWLANVLLHVPKHLRLQEATLQLLSSEMLEDYHMSVKKAIVEFVLRDPREKSEYELIDQDNPEMFLK